MKRLAVLIALALSLVATPVAAVNHPVVPADNCAPADEAGGTPARSRNQTPDDTANPPFSRNNPGVSEGAQGGEKSQAPCADDA